MDRDTIIAQIRRVASESGKNSLSKTEFKSKSGISWWHFYKHFDSWNAAIEAAGLTPTDVSRIDEADLFQEMKHVFVKSGGVCTHMKFMKLSGRSAKTYRRRYGKWVNTLKAFREWLQESGQDFPYLEQLPHSTESQPPKLPAQGPNRVVVWDTSDAVTYGPFLNFRGLQHAPINEQGVVFLFGMVCFELGYVVEAIRTGYPDCEAKRRVSRKQDEWQRVRIEFEYRSSEFKSHGHEPGGCDVIVCWHHDWNECPLEVLELKTAIQKLKE